MLSHFVWFCHELACINLASKRASVKVYSKGDNYSWQIGCIMITHQLYIWLVDGLEFRFLANGMGLGLVYSGIWVTSFLGWQILVPVPQYPLYSATISLLGGTLVPYYLEENENWGLDVNNLRQSVAQARSQGITVNILPLFFSKLLMQRPFW